MRCRRGGGLRLLVAVALILVGFFTALVISGFSFLVFLGLLFVGAGVALVLC